MVPYKDGKANRGHSCVKGRFAWGYATHQERILKPMVRAKITDPWREVSWDEAIAHTASEFKRIQAKYGTRLRSAASPPRAAPTRRPSWCRSWCAPASATTTSIPAPASAIRRPATACRTTFGTSAGTQDFDSVDDADVVMIIGANPTDGHPVFASRHEEAAAPGRQADRRRSAAHRPRAHAACRGGLPSAAAARHQRRRADRARPCRRHRGPGRRGFRARALRLGRIPGLGGVRRRAAQQPRGGRQDLRRAGRDDPRARRGSSPPAATARSIMASASPSTARARRR